MRGTNVWRIFNAVERHDGDIKQITHYDDGVGTHDLRWLRLLGGAFGWGFSRNITSAYVFLAMNYEPGDRIYLFGFSRGAFTVRSLAGLISQCGLLKREAVISAARRRKRVLKWILKAYRSTCENKKDKFLGKVRKVAESNDACFHDGSIPIHFIGVWDTVDAVGIPIDRMMKRVDRVWSCLVGRRLWNFHDRKLGRYVHYAYQALALDDERKTFYPVIWEHPNNSPEAQAAADCKADCQASEQDKPIIEQVWFAGVHSNVGGGYPKDSMSLVSLDWMMGKAEACELQFTDGMRKEYQRDADVHGRLYDSRVGLRAFYRYGPRKLMEKPAIHGSVFERIRRGTDYYAPKVIRENEYTVAWTDCGPYAEPQRETGGVNEST